MSEININGEVAVNESDYRKWRTKNIISIVICAVLFVAYIPIFALIAERSVSVLPYWLWDIVFDIPDVLWIIILFIILLVLAVLPYIFAYKNSKLFLVKKLNHLDNTFSYEFMKPLTINPKLAGIVQLRKVKG
jgi:hypothetical protein